MDARAFLQELRQRCGCSAWQEPEANAVVEQQLQEALPLLMMLVARLRNEASPEVLGEVRHSWHKALRRRAWDALPPLGTDGRRETGPNAPPTAFVSAGDSAHCARQVAAFLSLFGVPLTVDRAELAAVPGLLATVETLLPQARALMAGPLQPPHAYGRAYQAIVGRWHEVARISALRIPE